ncbi:uncharacterized protein LOC124651491 [Lolium rigidum]|uniref:uncharacterized protein LOC124651491 n=1 Tax=Lolium rigidum TaxID=89674 RepID=UPI001F5E11E9|nr:uncharacterized protein LOC124651491 [Lolium rigidum]
MALVELSCLFTRRSHIVSDNKHALYYPAILHREAIILEHEEKVNKYQAVLAAYLKDKYSIKASDKGGRSLRPHCTAVPQSRSRLPQANNSEAKDVVHEENQFITEAEDLDHEEKVNKYQGMLAARLKAKYFSGEAFDKELTGDMFEEITIQSETIRMSRLPLTSLFADPAKFFLEKRGT